MRVLLFGATGMVGQGVLQECLLDSGVEQVITLGRTKPDVTHPKLLHLVQPDLFHYESIESQLTGLDACFFCLGVSSADVDVATYERLTYGLTLTAATTLSRLNPQMTFTYVTGAGTDSTEQGRTRWARVKGRTENALLRLPFQAAYMFRPGMIVPVHGEIPKTRSYRILYKLLKPILPLFYKAFPQYVLTTAEVGQTMLFVVRHGAPKHVLEISDIRALVNKRNAR